LTMLSLLRSALENGVHVDEVARRLGMPSAQIMYITLPSYIGSHAYALC
jgi:hypothetical protein